MIVFDKVFACIFGRIQYRTFSTSNVILDKELGGDGWAKRYTANGDRYAPSINVKVELYDTMPWQFRMREFALCGTPTDWQKRLHVYRHSRTTYLIQVPTDRGRVIPEIDLINDDLPTL